MLMKTAQARQSGFEVVVTLPATGQRLSAGFTTEWTTARKLAEKTVEDLDQAKVRPFTVEIYNPYGRRVWRERVVVRGG